MQHLYFLYQGIQQMSPVVLVDGSYFMYRNFYGMPLLSTSTGLYTNAIRGTVSTLQKIIRREEPEYMAVVFDTKEPTYRHKLSPDYKSNRPPMPEELAMQIPFLHRIIDAFGIPILTYPGAEADDIIGTISTIASNQCKDTIIYTGDKDMAQLVDDYVVLEDPFKQRRMGKYGVYDKYGLRPDQIIDYLALMGDNSDGIKGVPGVGFKTASKLLREYNTLEELLLNIDKVGGKVGESIRNHQHILPMNKRLTTIDREVPINFGWELLRLGGYKKSVLIEIFRELEFYSLLSTMESTEDYY